MALEPSPSIVGTVQARVGTVARDLTCVIAVRVDGDRGPDRAVRQDGREPGRRLRDRRGRRVQLPRHQRLVQHQPPAPGHVRRPRRPDGGQRVPAPPTSRRVSLVPGVGTPVRRDPRPLRRLSVTRDALRPDGSALLPETRPTITTTPASTPTTGTIRRTERLRPGPRARAAERLRGHRDVETVTPRRWTSSPSA